MEEIALGQILIWTQDTVGTRSNVLDYRRFSVLLPLFQANIYGRMNRFKVVSLFNYGKSSPLAPFAISFVMTLPMKLGSVFILPTCGSLYNRTAES
jgi:hypothetical protein